MRINHPKFGLGIILGEPFISSGGKEVANVIFDARPDEERTMLLSALSESRAPMPAEAKEKPKRKPRKQKVIAADVVSDDLLIEPTPAEILPALDPLPTDESDYDDVGLLPDMGECTENEFIARNES